MTVKAIKKAFRELDASGQAALLKELVANLADSLAAEDAADARVMAARRGEESRSRPWRQVRADLLQVASRSGQRKR